MNQIASPNEPDIYDPEFVKDVFDRCSDAYIWFSTVCSFGFTERWRSQCVQALGPLPAGAAGYDLMAGSGEAWPHLLKANPQTAAIIAVDISSGMHHRAMARLHHHRAHKIEFIADNVLNSNLAQQSADFVICTFGLKTFNPSQQTQLAVLTARILKPGGRFSFIEASDPKGWPLRSFYRFHLFGILPFIERVFLRGAQDFAMIGRYSTAFGDAAHFAETLREQGLQVDFKRYFYGCATGVAGRKPAR